MKLKNNSPRDYIYNKIILKAGQILEISDERAIKILLNQPDVIQHVDIDEVTKLRAELAKFEAEQNETPKMLSRKEMLKIAEDKGLKFPKNISNLKLAELIK